MAVNIDLLVYVAKLREPWANSDVRFWPKAEVRISYYQRF
jgi:hypothetical protein